MEAPRINGLNSVYSDTEPKVSAGAKPCLKDQDIESTLYLDDGSSYVGKSFGAPRDVKGEVGRFWFLE